MIDEIKYKVISKLLKRNKSVKVFNGLLGHSKKILVIMPEVEQDFKSAIKIAEYLSSLHKDVTLFLNNSVLHLFYNTFNIKIEEYFSSDKSKLGIPKQNLKIKLKKNNYDVLIDLNKEENLFLSICTKYVNATYFIGFNKKHSDLFYDIQFSSRDNTENSYKNFLNYLQMFL